MNKAVNPSPLQIVSTYSRDYSDRSVDVDIETNGGTYHKVTTTTYYDDGHTIIESQKVFSRTKAITIAMYRTRKIASDSINTE